MEFLFALPIRLPIPAHAPIHFSPVRIVTKEYKASQHHTNTPKSCKIVAEKPQKHRYNCVERTFSLAY